MDRVAQIARAVLYEGYVLWPYRRSAPKNRQRWTFGGVFPESWSAEHPDDPAELQCQCLLEGPPEAVLSATVRCLHVVQRQALDAQGRPVDELEAGGRRHLSWEEATERELAIAVPSPPSPFAIPAGSEQETAGNGALRRSWAGMSGTVEAQLQALRPGLRRLTVRLRNTTSWSGGERAEALRHALVSTHLALRVDGGAFVSAQDPPPALREAAEECENRATWPILVGEEGDRSQMLCSPIILEDHPRIAPESPGDMFDGGEIDQLLILNVLALSDEERREMRDSDPQTRAILERCSSLTREDLMRLHGTIREMGPA